MSNQELELLFNKYYNRLYAYAYKHIPTVFIHDCIVDIFIKVKKDPRSIADYPSIANFLYRCIANRCIDMSRLHRYKDHWNTHYWSEERLFESYSESYEMKFEQTEEDLKHQKLLDTIKSIIPTLSNRMRQVIEMSFIEGVKHEEICLRLGISARTLLNTKYRALKIVKSHISCLNLNY